MRSGPPVYCHTSAVSFSPTAPCYAHKGRIYATRCRTQGLDSAVVCRAVFAYSRPCVRHRGGKGAKEGRGAEPRGKERLGFQGTAPAPRPHTFGYTPLGAPRWAARNAPEPRKAKVRSGAPAPASAIGAGGGRRHANGRRRTCQRQHSHLGAKGAAVPPGGPKRVWVSGLSGGFPDGCSKMRLSLGEITGIGPKPSNSDAKWNTSPPRRRNTAKPRRILDHYDTRTATHHITATAKAATGPPRASGSSGFLKHIRHEAQRLGGRTGSLREGRARHLREPAAPARVVPGGALDPDAVAHHCRPVPGWSLGLTGSAPGWAVGAHMCGRKRMARRTSARGATFMAAIAAL